MRLSRRSASKEVAVARRLEGDQPFYRLSSDLGDLELDRSTSLELNDNCAIANDGAGADVLNLEADQVGCSKLTVDGEVEEREVPGRVVAGDGLLRIALCSAVSVLSVGDESLTACKFELCRLTDAAKDSRIVTYRPRPLDAVRLMPEHTTFDEPRMLGLTIEENRIVTVTTAAQGETRQEDDA